MSAAPGERFEVEDLDADNVLAFLRDLDEEARRIEAFKLRAAAHWADLHPATAETGAAAPDGGVLDADELLGGEGTPAVAAFTPEDLAVVLQISPTSAAGMVADALDLRHRLPHLWRAVMRLQVPAWLARRVAQQTRRLPKGRREVRRRGTGRPGLLLGHRHRRPGGGRGDRPVRPRRARPP